MAEAVLNENTEFYEVNIEEDRMPAGSLYGD